MPRQGVLPPFETLRKWDVVEMCNWLKKCDFHEAIPVFKENNIDGERFVYLSEIQLFQMKNVSVKTKNGLKNAQKNVKGRPAVTKKTVITETARRSMNKVYDSINRIMATDRPPQTPSKDYKHYTPDIDDHDDGWGSDFSDPQEEEDDFDDEYEEPTPAQTSMPQQSAAHMNIHRRAPLMPMPGHKHGTQTRKSLPPEPPVQETYEDPNQLSSDEPEDYEEPVDIPPARVHTQGHSHAPPRKPSSATLPVKLPPRVPLRPKPEETYEIEDDANGLDEDYERPGNALSAPVAERGEIVSFSANLKPSNVVKKNYSRVAVPKPETKYLKSWVDQSGHDGPVLPSQLQDRQAKVPSHYPRPEFAVQKPPQTPTSNKIIPSKPLKTDRPSPNRASGLPGRALPRPPEDQEVEGLYSYTWYHGDLTRDSATEKLRARSQNGMFLVRKSTKVGSPYALSLFYGGRVYNLNIRLRQDNKYALGTPKQEEKSFSTVPPLISYFQNNTLVLGGDTSTQTTLAHSLPK